MSFIVPSCAIGGPHVPPLALGYVAARNAPLCQTTKIRCTQPLSSRAIRTRTGGNMLTKVSDQSKRKNQ